MNGKQLSDAEIERLIQDPETEDELRKALLITQVARATPGGLQMRRTQ